MSITRFASIKITQPPGQTPRPDYVLSFRLQRADRAALEQGGSSPGAGDRALADVLAFHGLAMSGGVLDAIERTSAADLARIGAAFPWFGLEAVDDLLASVRRDIQAGALDELDRAEGGPGANRRRGLSGDLAIG